MVVNVMMLGSKGLLPPTDANEKFRFELLRSKLLPQFCKHEPAAFMPPAFYALRLLPGRFSVLPVPRRLQG